MYKIDPERIFIVGNSSGAILTLLFAIENELRIKGIISLWGGAVVDSVHIENICRWLS